MTNSDTRPTEQGETRKQAAPLLLDHLEVLSLRHLKLSAIEAALNAERERALTDAAGQECVFCAGAKGFNPIPVEAALTAETDAGNYVHRNDPPHGLAGVYCKAPRVRALIDAIRKDQG